MSHYQIGIDVGGTFTDLVAAGGDESVHLKVPTPAENQAVGVHAGLDLLAPRLGLDRRELLRRTVRIVHGTTVATNMMIEGTGSRVGFITTAGFRDELEYRRGLKETIYDPTLPAPRPLARRRDRLGVTERMDANGSVVEPLDEGALRQCIRRLRETGCESLAVGFLFSFLNPSHELRARAIIEEEWPHAYLSLSHELLPRVREYERFSTAAVNSYVGPRTTRYLARLERELSDDGFKGEFTVIQSNGGVSEVARASRRPAGLLLSGPAGGVLGSVELIAKITNHSNVITMDMGGTSYDVCLIADGTPVLTEGSYVARHAVALPMFGIHTIGAGGGSIARVDAGSTLRVGPQSAGAVPGPACYGRGGTEPTVTDANLVLGYLNSAASFGGTVTLDPDAARQAIKVRVAEPMRLSVETAAYGILRMINAHMSNGIRVVSVQQGYDPRDFALVAFGGNGPVHAGRQAEDLGISTVLVPRMAGAFSAYGGLRADAQLDHLTTWIGDCESIDLRALDNVISRLLDKARRALGGHELTHEASLACHYAGQTSEIWVPLELLHDRVTPEAIVSAAESFHREHERERSFAKRDESVMIAGAKVSSRSAAPPLPTPREDHSPPGSRSAPQPMSRRRVYFDADTGWIETNIYNGGAIGAGDRMTGPAVIEEPDTTVVVYPGWQCLLEATNVYRLTRNGDVS